VPFREVYVHGLIRDGEGQKMSKSKGNVIDPLDIVDGIGLEALVRKRTTGLMQPHLAPAIEKATRKQFPEGIANYGTDALRFTFASLATQSRDIRFDMGRVGGYRTFCNKLWNVARYALLNAAQLPHAPAAPTPAGQLLSVADRWILSRLGHTLRAVDTAFTEYRFDFAATALYEFTWYEFCDWYVEFTKPVLQGDAATAEQKQTTRQTLLRVFEVLLRALHPLMPFITEELWQRIAPLAGVAAAADASIMLAPWPRAEEFPLDTAAETELRWLTAVILGVRQIRSEMVISPARKLPLLLAHASAADLALLQRHAAALHRLAGLDTVRALGAGEDAPPAATALVGELTLLVPMAGLIEPRAELERLSKQCAKIRQEIAKASGKLGNENFVRSAPEAVVVQERGRLADFERALASLERQLQAVQVLATTQ
jgi:valyl-tRNA synthetase